MSEQKFLNRKARRREISLARKSIKNLRSDKHRSGRKLVAASAIGIGASLTLPHGSVAQTVVPPAAGPCAVSGSIATCTGDVSQGIQATGPVLDTLNVNNVAAPGISPAAGINGIGFTTSSGNVTVNADTTGTNGISTTGDDAGGIVVDADGDGDINVTSVGNISTNGQDAYGIYAYRAGSGNVSITNTGDISTQGGNSAGIFVEIEDVYVPPNPYSVPSNGNITVTSDGDITTTGAYSDGISAEHRGGDGNVMVRSTGDISTQTDFSHGIYVSQNGGAGDAIAISTGNLRTAGRNADGIYAYQGNAASGNVSITSTGNIETTGLSANGLRSLVNSGDGNASISSTGDITTSTDNSKGLYGLQEGGDGAITIRSTGDITTTGSSGGDAIYAAQTGGDGAISVTSSGNLSTVGRYSDGIFVQQDAGDGAISVTSNGNISTVGNNSEGILAEQDGGNGTVNVRSTGDISTMGTASYGIFAYQNGGDGSVTVTSNGNITTTGNNAEGIFAAQNRGQGDVTVRSTGDISATGSSSDGIRAYHSFDGNVTVQSEGDITAGGNNALYTDISGSGDISITSNGTLNAVSGRAIRAEIGGDGDVTITTSGVIMSANESILVNIDGDGDILLENSADVLLGTNGSGSIDLEVSGDGNVRVMNSGNLTTDNDGIETYVDGAGDITIFNTGDITTRFEGIYAEVGYTGTANVVRIENAGIINSQTNGIEAVHDGATGRITIINSGNITSATTAIEVERRGPSSAPPPVAPATLTNSAVLTGNDGFSIDLRNDGNDVVNLLPGSILNGAIDFGNGNDGMGGTNPNDIDTLNFASGMNAAVNFADASGSDNDLASAPEIINFGGAGVVANGGLTAVAVDTTNFTAQGTFISDLTNSVFDAIDTATPTPSNPGNGSQVSRSGSAFSGNRIDTGSLVWGTVFGANREVDAEGSNTGFDHSIGGLVAGAETDRFDVEGTFGVLAGYSDSDISIDENAGDTDINAYFGGVYWKRDFGGFNLNASFIAGATDNETTRNVDGGTASGDFDGVFYSPSVSISAPLKALDAPVYFRARTNYVFMQLDDYTETGTALPLTVDDRNVSILNARAQLDYEQLTDYSSGANLDLIWSLGVDATLDAGSDNVDANVAATPFSFVADTDDAVAGFVGVNLEYTTANGLGTIGFNSKLQSTFGGGHAVFGELTATFRF